jgi:hypothetical protein
MTARRAYENETPERARETIARLCELHMTTPVRSKTTMSVSEHHKILAAIRDFALEGKALL